MAYTGYDYTDKVGTVVADLSSINYNGNIASNGYQNKFPTGQCTWYCFGRAYERARIWLQFNVAGDNYASRWLDRVVTSSGGAVELRDASKDPVANCIAVFSDGGYGHVVYVEDVEDDYVYFTEGNGWKANGEVAKVKLSNFKGFWSQTLLGYLRLNPIV